MMLALHAAPAPALTFNLTFTSGTTAQAQAGFQAAAAIWAAAISDPVTVPLTVGTASLGSGILGQAASRELIYDYSVVRTALVGKASSALDLTAVANLPVGAVPTLVRVKK
mgnify:CR=1 FL=1